jgi:hypothetical protein
MQVVPWKPNPYVPLYSACRAAPPADAVAQTLFKALWPYKPFAEYQRQSDTLRSKSVHELSAAEAEAYFVLLGLMEFQILDGLSQQDTAERRWAVLQSARAEGIAVAERFKDDSFVRCAYLEAELQLENSARRSREKSDKGRRAKARADFISFMESALRGEVRTDTYRDVLQSAIGQNYLDAGFELLPDISMAAPLFEAGAKHVCDAGANPTDDRYLSNWRRYAFMLNKLPINQQSEISQRLLIHLERTWGGKAAQSEAALEVYLHVLDFAGQTALEAGKTKDAVSTFERHLEVVQKLRRAAPDDPNHQTIEAFSYLLLGDAHIADRDTGAAAQAYDSAQGVFNAAGVDARGMLRAQDFPRAIQSRREALQKSARSQMR